MPESNVLGLRELRSIVDNVDAAISSLDSGLRYRFVNRHLAEITGIPVEHWLGKTPLDVGLPPAIAAESVAAVRKLFETGEAQHGEFLLPGASGKRFLAWRMVPERSASGAIEAALWIAQDISERRQLELTLRSRTERFAAFMQYSPTIAWLKDAEGHYLFASPAFERHFGIKPNAWLGRTDFDFLPPEFALQCRGKELLVLEQNRILDSTGPSQDSAGRMHEWLLVRFPFSDSQGMRCIGGLATDITERRRLEKTLSETQAQLKDIVDESPVIVWIKDTASRYTYTSRSFERRFGLKPDEFLGKTDADHWPPETAERFHLSDQQVLNGGRTIEAVESAPDADGTVRFWWVMKFPFQNQLGEQFVAGVGVDITERKRAEEQLKLQTLTDELTGVYNRRGFYALGDQELRVVRRTKQPSFVFFVDIDGLKIINDTYGHQAGDEAIVVASELIRIAFRETDIIGRLGGDEFAALAVNCNDVERVRARLSEQVAAWNQHSKLPWKLSLAVGLVALVPAAEENFESFVVRADTEMYAVKRAQKKAQTP